MKSKEAAWPQRFVVTGAAVGDGPHEVAPGTAIFVNGASWAIEVQHDPGGGAWAPSHQRLKFPTTAGGVVSFDIETDDAGGDGDFNDLVLTCSSPVTASDYVVYGTATAYSGRCYWNPCSRWPWLVIDTPEMLKAALDIPVLADAIGKLRVPAPKNPPDPPPLFPARAKRFVPLAIPLKDDAVVPPRRSAVHRTRALADGTRVVTHSRFVTAEATSAVARNIDRVAIASLLDGRFLLGCTTERLEGYALRFVEYDRTAAEASGGPYSGGGDRETLGAAVTDAFGNYIFRFSRTPQQTGEEYVHDVEEGESTTSCGLPDVIVQALASGLESESFHETYPHWGIAPLVRIDLCFPKSKIPAQATCSGVRNVQRLGDVSTLVATNAWSPAGRITATSSTIPGGWTSSCAAWVGSVEHVGCFPTSVARYTARWRKTDEPAGTWHFFGSTEKRLFIANLFVPGYDGDVIGPMNDLAVTLTTDPPSTATSNYPTYRNIAQDNAWVPSEWFRLFTLNTAALQQAGGIGTYEVRVDGFNASGVQVGGDSVTLFVDNDVVDVGVEDMAFSGVSVGAPGTCNLVTLPSAAAPLTVVFRAVEANGFLRDYSVSVTCCTPSGSFAVPVSAGGSYAHTPGGACDAPPASDYGAPSGTTVTATPSGSWLGSDTFGIVTVHISGTRRATNGKNTGAQGPWTASASFGIRLP